MLCSHSSERILREGFNVSRTFVLHCQSLLQRVSQLHLFQGFLLKDAFDLFLLLGLLASLCFAHFILTCQQGVVPVLQNQLIVCLLLYEGIQLVILEIAPRCPNTFQLLQNSSQVLDRTGLKLHDGLQLLCMTLLDCLLLCQNPALQIDESLQLLLLLLLQQLDGLQLGEFLVLVYVRYGLHLVQGLHELFGLGLDGCKVLFDGLNGDGLEACESPQASQLIADSVK
mmetsp:Transcript_41593/g.67180  ORF Transcript_41593/g.67180 Transcript_41593/m.67180 type:complete len:227 (+) Transcript_41593:659-1339(+)